MYLSSILPRRRVTVVAMCFVEMCTYIPGKVSENGIVNSIRSCNYMTTMTIDLAQDCKSIFSVGKVISEI